MKITLADLGLPTHLAISAAMLGWEAFDNEDPMTVVPPWFNAAERVIFHAAYGGYITSVNDLLED